MAKMSNADRAINRFLALQGKNMTKKDVAAEIAYYANALNAGRIRATDAKIKAVFKIQARLASWMKKLQESRSTKPFTVAISTAMQSELNKLMHKPTRSSSSKNCPPKKASTTKTKASSSAGQKTSTRAKKK